jgi:hypothetical protein
MPTFSRSVTESKTLADLKRVVLAAIGASGFMEMARFDLGEYLRRQLTEDCSAGDRQSARESRSRSLRPAANLREVGGRIGLVLGISQGNQTRSVSPLNISDFPVGHVRRARQFFPTRDLVNADHHDFNFNSACATISPQKVIQSHLSEYAEV